MLKSRILLSSNLSYFCLTKFSFHSTARYSSKMTDPQQDTNQQNNPDQVEEQEVTPWDVKGGSDGIDYGKLVDKFGCQHIDDELLSRFERVTGHVPHHFLRRGVFFAHRDLTEILDWHEQGKPWYLYTGRGPSSEAMHMGHMVPFLFTKYLQDVFNIPLIIQITDDEKYYMRDIESPERAQWLAYENIKDIIAVGFDIDKTFIFSDYDYSNKEWNMLVSQLRKSMTGNQVRGAFGFSLENNVGSLQFPAVQAAPSFGKAFPHIFGGKGRGGDAVDVKCLIPCAIDQDPYFRLTRDIAPRLGLHKPALIESKFFPALQGDSGKMSASIPNSAIFLTDTAKEIKDKINKHAFSGGGATLAEHQQNGANLAVDVAYKYLTFFCGNDELVEKVRVEYGAGRMTTAEQKGILINLLQNMVSQHQKARKQVTDAVVDAFTSPRPMYYTLFGGST